MRVFQEIPAERRYRLSDDITLVSEDVLLLRAAGVSAYYEIPACRTNLSIDECIGDLA